MLPLHYVAGAPLISASFVEELIKVYPDSIMQQDKNGDTPLHLQLVNTTNRQNANGDQNTIQVTELLLGEKEDLGHGDKSASSPMLIQNSDGLSPLHVCALFGVPFELTKILMESSFVDEAVRLKTDDGSCALHLACRSEQVSEMVNFIQVLSSKKGACSIADNEGRTPLINAVQNPDASVDVVKILCRAYPEGLIVNENGTIALHEALSMGPNANAGVVKALLKAAPKTINVVWEGNSVLTEALKCRVPKSVTKVLMEKLCSKEATKSKRTSRSSMTTTS
jgi:ankyrin repeat protein